MFTVEQIQAAHSKVKSGAEFPAYIQEIKRMGVSHYECYVSDGHTDYHGNANYTARVSPKYDVTNIADATDIDQFKLGLKAHQQGKTDFMTFVRMCAAAGIEKWVINMHMMNCTYFDKTGKEILVEMIPH